MFRRFTLILVILLCSYASSAITPTVTPPPTSFTVATMPPVGATILPSDVGTPPPTDATQNATPAGTVEAPSLPVPTDTTLAATPDAALRNQFKQDITTVPGMSRYHDGLATRRGPDALDGRQTVTYTNRTGTPLKEIYFRLFANYPGESGKINVTSVAVNGAPASLVMEAQNTAIRVPLATPLAPNAQTTLDLTYTVNIPAKSPVHYSDFVNDDWITTLPTIYPIIPAYRPSRLAYQSAPFGDLVYADSSLYDVTITAPAGTR